MWHMKFKPYEFISVRTISFAIIYVLFGQLLFGSGIVLPVLTLLSLVTSVVYFGNIKISQSYGIFLLITSIFSLLITDDMETTKSCIVLLLKALLFFIAIINSMKFESGFKCIRLSTIFSGVMIAIMLFNNSAGGGRVSASDKINENVVAATLLVSVFMSVYELEKRKKKIYRIIILFCIGIMSFASVLTGTRKIFLAIVAFICLYLFITKFINHDRKMNLRKLSVIIIGITFLYFFVSYAMDSIIGERFLSTGYEGDKMRQFFYLTAFNMFKEKPLFGFGWGGFTAKVGMYSHSTYGELLANTGCIGIVLFFVYVFSIIVKIYRKIRYVSKTNNENYNVYKIALLSFLILLILGLGTVLFYEINLTLAIAIVYFLSTSNTYEQRREEMK